jgi:hypothetical protein
MKLKKKHFNFINYLKKQILIKINQTWKKKKLKGYFKKIKEQCTETENEKERNGKKNTKLKAYWLHVSPSNMSANENIWMRSLYVPPK